RRSFRQHDYFGGDDFLQYSVAIGRPGGLTLVALDSVDAGCRNGSGTLCSRRLQWLDAELARLGTAPVVIALHHPPFRTFIGHMDRIGLQEGGPELAEILAHHPQVERVICGHLHRTIYAQVGGRVVSTAPSPAHQITLDLADEADETWMLEPPGFHLHAWTTPGSLVTHAVPIGTFEGPYPLGGNGMAKTQAGRNRPG
ncbi:MAG: phosphodiesterase, partial [Betaproteobacteria bacterium]